MARIFTIIFRYEEVEHHAMVAVKSNPFYTEYQLSLPEALLLQLPSNKIISSPPGDLSFVSGNGAANHRLMQAIISAVREHLNLSTISS